MHCDWPVDFYEDCASPASEILFQFFENVNDTPPPDDPTIIAAGTLLLESSHDPGHLPNVANDEDSLVNQIINVVNHAFFSYDEASSHSEDSNSLSPVGSSPSLSLELDISDVESDADDEALEDEQTDMSSADDYFGEDVASSSQEMSENATDSQNELPVSSLEFDSPLEQFESGQEMLSCEENVEKPVSYDGDISDDSSSMSEDRIASILDEMKEKMLKSRASSEKQSSSDTFPKPSTSKCDNENTCDETDAKSHDSVPSCPEKENSNNENSCDNVVLEEQNSGSSKVLQGNIPIDESDCMESNSVLESDNDNSHEDTVVNYTRNTDVSELGAGSSSGSDRSGSKLKHKIGSDPEDGVPPNKVPKYDSEAVSASNVDNLRDQ